MKPGISFFPTTSLPLRASERWIACAYDVFSKEGPNGIRVERLARILKINKSGFYHYFDDIDAFYAQLIEYHYRMVDAFLNEVAACKNLDPDYLHVFVKHDLTIQAQIHLVRNKTDHRFLHTHEVGDEKIVRASVLLWIDYTRIDSCFDIAYDYWRLVRDMMYTRIELRNFTIDNIRVIMEESRAIMTQISQGCNRGTHAATRPE